MAHMPEWFAKTPEMFAMDRYYSGLDRSGNFDPQRLIDRYVAALKDIRDPSQSFQRSKALDEEAPDRVIPGLTKHFKRDWLYRQNPLSPDKGGDFWPQVPSLQVMEGLKYGIEVALKRALGRDNIPGSMANDKERDDLFSYEETNNIDSKRVMPLVTTWNCVAPGDSTFFDTQSIRGPTVVEWAIATPVPRRYSSDHAIVRALQEHDYDVED